MMPSLLIWGASAFSSAAPCSSGKNDDVENVGGFDIVIHRVLDFENLDYNTVNVGVGWEF